MNMPETRHRINGRCVSVALCFTSWRAAGSAVRDGGAGSGGGSRTHTPPMPIRYNHQEGTRHRKVPATVTVAERISGNVAYSVLTGPSSGFKADGLWWGDPQARFAWRGRDGHRLNNITTLERIREK